MNNSSFLNIVEQIKDLIMNDDLNGLHAIESLNDYILIMLIYYQEYHLIL